MSETRLPETVDGFGEGVWDKIVGNIEGLLAEPESNFEMDTIVYGNLGMIGSAVGIESENKGVGIYVGVHPKEGFESAAAPSITVSERINGEPTNIPVIVHILN